MANENHIRHAGRSIARGARNAADAASEGRMGDAAESAWEGTATAARETGKSAAKGTQELLDGRDED